MNLKKKVKQLHLNEERIFGFDMNGKSAFNEWQRSEKVKCENSKCFKDI